MEIDNEPDANLDDGDVEDEDDTGDNDPTIELQMDIGKKRASECIRAELCFTFSCVLARQCIRRHPGGGNMRLPQYVGDLCIAVSALPDHTKRVVLHSALSSYRDT
jgi:hypothetical protein